MRRMMVLVLSMGYFVFFGGCRGGQEQQDRQSIANAELIVFDHGNDGVRFNVDFVPELRPEIDSPDGCAYVEETNQPDWLTPSSGLGLYVGLKKDGQVYLATVHGSGRPAGKGPLQIRLILGESVEVQSTYWTDETKALRQAVPNVTNISYQGIPDAPDPLVAPTMASAKELLKKRGECGFVLEEGVLDRLFPINNQRIPGGSILPSEYPATLTVEATKEKIYRFKAANKDSLSGGWTHLGIYRWDIPAFPGNIVRINKEDLPDEMREPSQTKEQPSQPDVGQPSSVTWSCVVVQKSRMSDGTWWLTAKSATEPPKNFDPKLRPRVKVSLE